jgi:CRISPR-associated RAMP protein (TIGR02581 family)
MLKRLINHACIDFDIIPMDPLLVKSSQAAVSGANMAFVRIKRQQGKDEPFIPGSSLKGVIRSYAEKICRSLKEEPVPVCLPYEEPNEGGTNLQAACGLRFEKYKKNNKAKSPTSTQIYQLSCPVCRLFGTHVLRGRLSTSDAYLTDAYQQSYVLETRDGVAIDRLTGGAAPKAKYDLEVLTRGEFTTTLEIRNFERWQLGLLGLVMHDMEQGLLRLGFGKSRGLGRFKIEISKFSITYYGRKVEYFTGLSTLCTSSEKNEYGFFEENKENNYPLTNAGKTTFGLRQEFDITGTWKECIEPGVKDLTDYLATLEWPGNLDDYMRRRR